MITATKLAPPRVPAGWVPRARLTAALDHGIQGPLTLVAAGPGTGKSALLAGWIADHDGPEVVAWLSLDPADRDPRRFWGGVFGALRRAAPDAPALHPAEDPEIAVPLLVNAVADAGVDVVLVVDDLHDLHDGPVLGDLDRLLRRAPPNLRLVFATRTDPPLRLARLRLDGDLAEIREAELAFTEPEAQALLAPTGLDADAMRRLWQRTEGWAAGLRMAALALRTHPDPERFVDDFAGDDVAMADYLLVEVLAQHPPELVDFLVTTSILGQVRGDLADAVTGTTAGAATLERLAAEHMLVTALTGPGGWFRYHTLLRELLHSRLRFRPPAEVEALHARAARWYLAHERPAAALRHAGKACDWDLVATLAASAWLPMLARGELASLRDAVERLPDESAEVALAHAAVLADAGDATAAGERLALARERAGDVPAARRAAFAAGVDVITALLAWTTGNEATAVAAGDRVVAAADDDLARAVVLQAAGAGAVWLGELEAGVARLEQARRAAARAGCAWLALVATSRLAAAAFLRGRAAEAARLAEDALAQAAAAGSERTWPAGLAHLTLSVLAYERDDLAAAEVHLAHAEPALQAAPERPMRGMARVHAARLRLVYGDAEAALRLVDDAGDLLAGWPVAARFNGLAAAVRARALAARGRLDEAAGALRVGAPSPQEAAALARLHLATGEPAAAHAALEPWARTPVPGAIGVEVQVLSALAHDAEADHGAAADALERALDGAEPSAIRRPFSELGDRVGPLLRRQLRTGTGHRALVGDLLEALERPERAGAATGFYGVLSERELAVLRFLPTMMSNVEIAGELFVSVNTVKTHLKAIYRKLDVGDRRGAVRRARELELLAP